MRHHSNVTGQYVKYLSIFAINALICLIAPTHAAEPTERTCAEVGHVTAVQGTLEFKTIDSQNWQLAELNQSLCVNDIVRVDDIGRAVIRLNNETLIKLDENTTLTLNSVSNSGHSVVNMLKGLIQIMSRVPRSLEVETPYVNAAIEGTEFIVSVDSNKTDVTVYEGSVKTSNASGEVLLTPGESSAATINAGPIKVSIDPSKQVQWALYYPPIVDPELLKTDSNDLTQALRLFSQGQVVQANDILNNFADKTSNDYLLTKAAVELSIGNSDNASSLLNNISDNETSDALLAILELRQQNYASAEARINKNLNKNSPSAISYIAASYLQQYLFDIDQAETLMVQAQEIEPSSALLTARLAEIYLMQGDYRNAKKTADNALALAPDNVKTQTVAGFTKFRASDFDDALENFANAIIIDSSDPTPWLGQGLIKIRRGNLPAGRQDLETAAILDPNNALLRAYLGKAYLEENRYDKAGDQLALAKSLDENDPTGYFYNAILLASQNQSYDAIQEFQQAINKNENRAIYRSRQLLASDEASRNNSLSMSYKKLGFDNKAELIAKDSIRYYPTDFASHRLLADSYLDDNNLDVARLSEILQSRLLQPVGHNIYQPQISQSGAGSILTSGFNQTGYNEYNSMFNQNGAYIQSNIIAGNNNTLGSDIIASYLTDRFNLSYGGYKLSKDIIFSNNNGPNEHIAEYDKYVNNAFFQTDVNELLSLQLDYTKSKTYKEDIRQRFFINDDFKDIEFNDKKSAGRIGIKYKLAPKHTSILSYISSDYSVIEYIDEPIGDGQRLVEDTENNRDAYIFEVQNISLYDSFTLTSGYTRIKSEADKKTIYTYLDGVNPPFELGRNINEKIDYFDSLYLNIKTQNRKNINIDAELSYSNHESIKDKDNSYTLEKLHPKLGISWKGEKSSLNLAAFQTFSLPLFEEPTIRPTLISNVNQIYDERLSTTSDNYALSYDQDISSKLSYNIDFLVRRNINSNDFNTDTQNNTVKLEDYTFEEKNSNVNINWLINERFSLYAGYNYYKEKETTSTTLPISNYLELKTEIIPISLKYHSRKTNLSLTASKYLQSGEFLDVFKNSSKGKDDFWITNAEFQYLFAKELGSISFGVNNIFNQEFQFEDVSSYKSYDINESASPSSLSEETTWYILLNLKIH